MHGYKQIVNADIIKNIKDSTNNSKTDTDTDTETGTGTGTGTGIVNQENLNNFETFIKYY